MLTTQPPPLSSTLSNDPEMRELVEMFVSEIPQKISNFEAHLALRDWGKLNHLAHQLKGSAGGYGFDVVTPYAYQVEQAAQSEQPVPELVQNNVRQLLEVLRRLSV